MAKKKIAKQMGSRGRIQIVTLLFWWMRAIRCRADADRCCCRGTAGPLQAATGTEVGVTIFA